MHFWVLVISAVVLFGLFSTLKDGEPSAVHAPAAHDTYEFAVKAVAWLILIFIGLLVLS